MKDNKKDLQKNIDKMKKEIAKMEEKLKEEEIIRVPDCIGIEKPIGSGDNLGIIFSNNKQTLYYNSFYKIWRVSDASPGDKISCKLIKVDRTELEVGHTYFRTEVRGFTNIEDIENYCKYLGNGSYVYSHANGVRVSYGNWNHWYKVVSINE